MKMTAKFLQEKSHLKNQVSGRIVGRLQLRRLAVAACVVPILLCSLPALAAPSQVVKGHIPAAATRLRPIDHLGSTNRLRLAIGLPLRNEAALDSLIQDLSNPASPNYRRYLTTEQFTKNFGPTKEDYQAVMNFAKSHGLKVTVTHPNRVVLDVEGAAPDIEKAFNLNLRVYQHPKEARTFFAPDAEPSLDLGVRVLHISGLDNFSLPHPNSTYKPLVETAGTTPNTGAGPIGTYMGNDFRAAYVSGTSLNGSGQSVGLLQFDGYYPSDITKYETLASLPNVSLVNVPIDGGVNTPGDGNIEVCLDIEMVISMAPGISTIYVYEAPNPSPWVDLLSRMANDNLSRQLSCSWGGGSPDPTSEAIFKQMAVQGQSFFNASGDSDAFTGAIPFPADSPHITQVGGTMLTTTGPGGSYVSETVWNSGDGGSSGGISTYYSIPSYQQGIDMSANNGSPTMRNVPDVALTASNVLVTCNNGHGYAGTGTSCAAPLWAGLAALINQQASANGNPSVGFLNPALYALGRDPHFNSVFNDITVGDNTWTGSQSRFQAVAGYDLCTGWGTPAGQNLINALAGGARTDGLDTSFNGGGKLATDFGLIDIFEPASANAVAVQADGKIVVAGLAGTDGAGENYGALVRYNSDGSMDTGFGDKGSGLVVVGTPPGSISSIAIRSSDQRIAAVAPSYDYSSDTTQFAVLRLLPNGTPDTSFNSSGMAVNQFPGALDTEPKAVAFQQDGKVVILAQTDNTIGLARYLDNGQLDTTFGSGGGLVTTGAAVEPRAIAIQGDGKIIVAGSVLHTEIGPGSLYTWTYFQLVRFNPDGSLDTSFGNGGAVVTAFNGSDAATSLAVQTDGKIVVAGATYRNADSSGPEYENFAVARYATDGSLDSSFGIAGKRVLDLDFGNDEAHGVAVLGDGRIVLVGSSDCCNNGGPDFAIARLKPDGTPDASFGPNANGLAHITFGANSPAASANAVAVDGDGRVVVAGATAPSGISDLTVASKFAIARLLMGESPRGGYAQPVPGLMLAGAFDDGGPGVAYYDTTPAVNDVGSGPYLGTTRPGSGVDMEKDSPGSTGEHVGYIHAGEWLKYSVNVAASGSYQLVAQVSCNGNGGTFHIEMDGANVTSTMTIPNTGGWLVFQNISKNGVALSAGAHIMRVVFDSNGANGSFVGNLKSIQFVATAAPRLTITRSGSNVVLSWPSSASGYVLQVSTDITLKTSWTAVSQPVVQVGSQNTVTLPASQSRQFFRLKQ